MPAKRPRPESNVRSPAYLVATTMTRCWHCGASTCVLALALPGNHEILDDETWQSATVGALIFHVERLAGKVAHRLAAISPHYRWRRALAVGLGQWANHCEQCGEILDDQELHCEFGAAFVPSSEIAASKIRLQRLDEPVEAAAAGYSVAPEFLDFGRRT